MPDQKFEEKWDELQQYVPFLKRIINNLIRTMKDRPRPVQLEKMEMLHDLLTKRDKTKLKYETLIKCETLLNKIYNKVEKPLSQAITMSNEVVEILEPDSPPTSNEIIQKYHAPIEIPTERKETPEPDLKTQSLPPDSNKTDIVISSDLSLEELIKQRQFLENKIFNCNQNSNSNSSNDIPVIKESKQNEDIQKLPINTIKHDFFDIQSLSNSPPISIEKIKTIVTSTTTTTTTKSNESLYENKDLKEGSHNRDSQSVRDSCSTSRKSLIGTISNSKDDYNEKNKYNSSLVNDSKKTESWTRNYNNKYDDRKRSSYEPGQKTFNRNELNSKYQSTKISLDKSKDSMRSSSPDWDAEYEEEEKLKNKKNESLTKKFEHKEIDSPRSICSKSSSRERSLERERDRDWNKDKNRHHNKNQEKSIDKYSNKEYTKDRDGDYYSRPNKNLSKFKNIQDDSEKNRTISLSPVMKLSSPSSLLHVAQYFEEIESSDSNSSSPKELPNSKINDKIDKLQNAKTSKENLIKANENPISTSLIKDVLKSPPLSANDIDDLLHESSNENTIKDSPIIDKSLLEVRKKLAKITKLNQNLNGNENKIKDTVISSPDQEFLMSSDASVNDRLALKYHPHIKKTSNNVENIIIPNRSEKLSNTVINNFPGINVNDPRLRIKSQSLENKTMINESFPLSNHMEIKPPVQSHINFGQNLMQNKVNQIPSLLSKIIPPPSDMIPSNMIPSNMNMTFSSNLIDIPLTANIPLINSNLQTSNYQQQQQSIPLVTIPKATFSDFLNNQNHMMSDISNAVDNIHGNNKQSGYNMINPLLNDNFERQKYLESKKSKNPNEDLFSSNSSKIHNAQPKTYGEYRRQCELERSKVSKLEINKSGNSSIANSSMEHNKNIDINSAESVSNDESQTNSLNSQTKDTKFSNLNINSRDPRQISRRRDSIHSKNESEKHLKSSNHDNGKLTNSNSSSSISKFKIPKKSKDDLKEEQNKIENKTENQKCSVVNVGKNLDKNLKIKDHVDLSTEESNEKLLNTTEVEKNNENETSIDNSVEISESKKSSGKRKAKFVPLKSEKDTVTCKPITGRRKSMTSIAQFKECNEEYSVSKSKISTNKINLRRKSTSIHHEGINSDQSTAHKDIEEKNNIENLPKDDNESLKSFDSTSVSSFQGVGGKSIKKRGRRYNNFYYEVAPDPVDNTVLSVENIIEGKRRSRSNANMSENSVISSSSFSKTKSNDSTLDVSNISETNSEEPEKNVVKKNEAKQPDLQNSELEISQSSIQDDFQKINEVSENIISTDSNVSSQNLNVDINVSEKNSNPPSTSFDDKTDINPNMLESLFLKMFDPNSKKENLLGVLSKVCDGKKFEKIKAILEEDDKSEQNKTNKKLQNDLIEKTEVIKKCKVEKQNVEENVENAENADEISHKEKDEKLNEKNPKKIKHKTELDRLNEDIRDMFISKEVLSAYDKRSTVQSNLKKELNKTKTEHETKLSTATKSLNPNNFKMKKIKIYIKRLHLNVSGEKTMLKTKTNLKRKRLWAKGNITKKKTSTLNSTVGKPIKRNQINKNNFENIENLNSNPSSPASNDAKTAKNSTKPCPKSKKKFIFNDESSNYSEISSNNEVKTNIISEAKNVNSSLELSLMNECPPKNINPAMHAKSIYSKKCLVCSKPVPNILAFHYANHHPEFEIFVSRLPPDTLKDLKLNINNSALYQYIGKGRCAMFHYRCPFCDIQLSASRAAWIGHFSSHTGEFHYKCSGCGIHSNVKSFIQRHIKNNCKKSKIITKEYHGIFKSSIPGFICNICDFIQLVPSNIIKHLQNQHSLSHEDSTNFHKIILMKMQNIPKVDDPPNDETTLVQEENFDEIAEDFAKNQTNNNMNYIGDKLDAFIPKEQTDMNLDKNLLNYMNEVESSDMREKTSKSIVDELSERLNLKKSENVNEFSIKSKTENFDLNTKEKNLSIVDVLSQRFQNLAEVKTPSTMFFETETENENENEKEEQSDSNNETPVVYILDQIDDDNLDNMELVESSEQVIVPINKPISNSSANLLDKIGGSSGQLKLPENKKQITDSIYEKLNEKLKNSKQSPDKKVAKVDFTTNQQKSGITIIDRLNKRLKGVDDLEKNKQNLSLTKTKKVKNSTIANRSCDSGDDNLVIDEDYDVTIIEDTSVADKTKTGNSSNLIEEHNYVNVIDDDDDCWEDIEVLSPSSSEHESVDEPIVIDNKNEDKNKKNVEKTQNSKDNKNKAILKTLSKLYVSFGKNKQILKTKSGDNKTTTSVASPIATQKNDKNLDQQQSVPLTDFINDTAIPSPISTELITDPPVPLPSEPLSDLNDISEILEPVPCTNSSERTYVADNSNTFSISEGNIVSSSASIVNINDINEPIYILPDSATIVDALALAAEIGNNVNAEKVDEKNLINKNCIESPIIPQFRINNLGFNETNGNIKYLCLIEGCSFVYSDQEFGIQNHYNSEHTNVCWDGYCYTCEANICSEDELPIDRELKHMTEVHIKNLLKSQNFSIETNQNSDSNKSFEDVLMANRPKITIRRLSGDLLSKNKPEPKKIKQQPPVTQPNVTRPIKISLIQNVQLQTGINNATTTISSCGNDQTENSQNLYQGNFSIKDLLSTPSVPPPILPTLLTDITPQSQSISVANIQIPQRSQVKTYKRQNTGSKVLSQLNAEKSNLISTSNLVIPPITNNSSSGSGLKISSVSQGVTVSDKEISSITNSLTQKSTQPEQLKIISVIGGVNNIQTELPSVPQLSTLTPIGQMNPQIVNNSLNNQIQQVQQPLVTEISEISSNIVSNPIQMTQTVSKPGFLRIDKVCSLGAPGNINEVKITPAVQTLPNTMSSLVIQNSFSVATPADSNDLSNDNTSNDSTNIKISKGIPNNSLQTTLNEITTNSETSSSSIVKANSISMRIVKPWSYPTVAKAIPIARLQLRPIALFALYKCMNLNCFFATNSIKDITEHFENHEKTLSNNENQTIIPSIEANIRDWLRCSYCSFVASNTQSYLTHFKNVHINDVFQCPYCFYRSCNDFSVMKHLEEYHSDMNITILVCQGYQKRLSTEMKHLAIYRSKYIKPIPCYDCNENFFIIRNYLKHLNIHNPNIDCYTCGICHTKGLLKKCADTHLSLVHKISIYQCIYCDMSSSLRSIMVTHMAKDHPSNLLYSCVRVSPNKNMTFPIETLENSTVLANLNEPVNQKYLFSCNFLKLNSMIPSLSAKALEFNKSRQVSQAVALSQVNSAESSIKISSVTSLATSPAIETNVSADPLSQIFQSETASLSQLQNVTVIPNTNSIIISDVGVATERPIISQENNSVSPASIGSTTTSTNPGITFYPVKQTDTDETITIDDDSENEQKIENSSISGKNFTASESIVEILKNCTQLTRSLANKQQTQDNNSNKLAQQQPIANIIINSVDTQQNKTQFSSESEQSLKIENSNESNSNSETIRPSDTPVDLYKRIIEAATEYVLDTGYEGSELYRCSAPECSDIKLNTETFSTHYFKIHSRLRSFKCPHCTCQYGNIRGLKVHLASHKRHRYFCFLCNHTSSVQSHLTKHITELHGKNSGLMSFPLSYSMDPNSASNNNDFKFYVIGPAGTKQQDVLEFGDRLIRTCERKRSLSKRSFSPNEIDQLPFQAIFNSEVFCSLCSYRTKVRTNIYRHLLFHKTEVKVASIDPVNPVPCLVSNEKNFDKMINMALSSNLNKENNEKPQIIGLNVGNASSEIVESTEAKLDAENIELANVLKNIDTEIPSYISPMRRFTCGVPNCTYLTIADYMLKCHLQTLHSAEKHYKCPHCNKDIITKKNFCPEKILQHLKFHDSRIYLCGECSYMHFLKYVVERHINDRHPNETALFQYERTDTNTVVTKQAIACNRLGVARRKSLPGNSSEEATEIANIPTKADESIGLEQMKWICTTCKFKTADEPAMIIHINSVHSIRFRYGCFFCKFGGCQINLVKEHITDKHHNFQQRQVKSNYCRIDESDNDIVQENRPLWTRSDPYRIKHIRGILMEDEDDGNKNNNENKKSNKLKKVTPIITVGNERNVTEVGSKRKSLDRKLSDNSLIEKITVNPINDTTALDTTVLNESLISIEVSNSTVDETITKDSKQSLNKLKIRGQSQSINLSSPAKDQLEDPLKIDERNLSAAGATHYEGLIEIYECYYCQTKNISFKVIYTHWLLHHCKKPSEKLTIVNNTLSDNSNSKEKCGPLLAKPFAFKIVGYIGADANEVSCYDVTSNQLVRLLKMGVRVTRFQCNKCWRLFANSISVSDHLKNEHASSTTHNLRCLTFKNRNFFICSSCGYASSLECKTAAHLLNHYEGLKKCVKCNKEFSKFLDFIRHLPQHNMNFKAFLQMDNKINDFWSKIIVLFPNGLCMMRCNIPKNSGIILSDLLDIVNNEVKNALQQTTPKIQLDYTAGVDLDLSLTRTSSSPISQNLSTSLNDQEDNNSLDQNLSDKSDDCIIITESESNNIVSDDTNLEKNLKSSTDDTNTDTTTNDPLTIKSITNDLPISNQILESKNLPSTSKSVDQTSSKVKYIYHSAQDKMKIHNIKHKTKKPLISKKKTNKKKNRNKTKRKYSADCEWTPSHLKKKKKKKNPLSSDGDDSITSESSISSKYDDDNDDEDEDNDNENVDDDDTENSENEDDDDDEDDNLPLTELRNATPVQYQNEKKLKPFIGPKFTQKKFHNAVTPYSYYGTKPKKEDLSKLIVNAKFDNEVDESITLTCEQYSDIIPINCSVLLEKLNPNIVKLNSVNLLKRTRTAENDIFNATSSNSSVIDESDSSSVLVRRCKKKRK